MVQGGIRVEGNVCCERSVGEDTGNCICAQLMSHILSASLFLSDFSLWLLSRSLKLPSIEICFVHLFICICSEIGTLFEQKNHRDII